jgi:hypothetical protein
MTEGSQRGKGEIIMRCSTRPYIIVIGNLLVLALVVAACGERIVSREAVTKKGHFGARSRIIYERSLWLQRENEKSELMAMYSNKIVFALPPKQRVLILRQTADGLVELKALDYPYEGEKWWTSKKAIEIKKGGSPWLRKP